MTNQKRDSLSYDILAFLKKVEPNMVLWNRIVKGLWDSYKFRYGKPETLGTEISKKLKVLIAEGEVKKESIFYGTKNAKSPEEKLMKEDFLELAKELIRAEAQIRSAELSAYTNGERQ